MISTSLVKREKREKRKPQVYQYQKDGRYFAQVIDNIKEAGAEEIAELGAKDIRVEFSGIRFRADKHALYRINYESRLLSRILAPIISYSCHDSDTLYQKARQVRWEDFLTENNTFAISGNVSDSNISHSKYATLRLKDAIADYFRGTTGQRPNVSVRNPDVQLNLHVRKDYAVISVDTSGGALHRRGYREETVIAPMQETIAAAVVRFTDWNGTLPLYDPMCGSGTLLCEALMRYCNIPAGIFRKQFGFECLPDFDRSVWKEVKMAADNSIRDIPEGLIAGSDISDDAVRATRTNLMGLHFGNKVTVQKTNFKNLPALEKHVIVANPPYGIRIGGDENLESFYQDVGDFLKQKCKGSTAYIYFGERKYMKHIGLKASWKKPIQAGKLNGRLVKYELY